MILKLILFFIAIGWVLSALVKFFLRSKLRQFVNHVNEAQRADQRQRSRAQHGDINVDYIPKGKDRPTGSIRGGEYVDYEEVKD